MLRVLRYLFGFTPPPSVERSRKGREFAAGMPKAGFRNEHAEGLFAERDDSSRVIGDAILGRRPGHTNLSHMLHDGRTAAEHDAAMRKADPDGHAFREAMRGLVAESRKNREECSKRRAEEFRRWFPNATEEERARYAPTFEEEAAAIRAAPDGAFVPITADWPTAGHTHQRAGGPACPAPQGPDESACDHDASPRGDTDLVIGLGGGRTERVPEPVPPNAWTRAAPHRDPHPPACECLWCHIRRACDDPDGPRDLMPSEPDRIVPL